MTEAKKARRAILRSASINGNSSATIAVEERSENTIMVNGRMRVSVAIDGIGVGGAQYHEDGMSLNPMLTPDDLLVGFLTAAMYPTKGVRPSKDVLRRVTAKIKTACAAQYRAN